MKKLAVIIGVTILVGIISYKLFSTDYIRVRKVNSDFPTLHNGEYIVGKDISLTSGQYAIYAKEGSGKVIIDNQTFNLDDDLYTKAQKQSEKIRFTVIYEESPKIKILDKTIIKVIGNKEFDISFVKR